MARVKASGIMTVRQLLAQRGAELLRAFTARLSPETLKAFQTAVATSWISFPAEAEIFDAAAALLFPGDGQGLRKLGAAVAQIQFTGVYKAFLMVASVSFIVKRVATIWNTIYDSGQARVENLTNRGGVLVATGLPDQLPTQREYICGFLTRLLEFAGAKNIRVTKLENDPQAWKWLFAWEQ